MNGEHSNVREAPTTDRQLHTQGPWHIYPRNPLVIESAKGNIALVNLARASEADARLIAAAPDLLTALKAMDESLCNGFDTQAARHAGRMALIAARAAIAKAEGRS